MTLLQMMPFEDYTTVCWCLFSLPVALAILLGLRFTGVGLRFLTSFFAGLSLVTINMWQCCIGVGKRVIHKILGTRRWKAHRRRRRAYSPIVPAMPTRCIPGIGHPLEMSSEIKDLAPKDVRRGDCEPVILSDSDESNEIKTMPVSGDAMETFGFISRLDKGATEKAIESISSVSSIPRMSKEAPGYILEEDAQWHQVKHGKMKEAPGEILSCISKEDARRHQVDNEEIKSAHGLNGMDNYVIQVLHFLECTSLSILGITGMHGVGKTTLLRLVRNFLADRSSLDYVFYLGLGTGCTVGSLQHSILAKILGPQHQISDTLTAAKIISSSLKDKTFLFLLDDLREPRDLVAIGLPMPLGRRQQVIFTTPDQAMCDEIGCAGINMQSLGEEDAWSLFKTEVHDEIVEKHPAFKQLAKKIVQECQGLPIALVAFGQAMSVRKDIREWRHVCELLEVKHQLSNEIRDLPYPSSREFIWHLLM